MFSEKYTPTGTQASKNLNLAEELKLILQIYPSILEKDYITIFILDIFI
jgi:hypothetical protein